MVHLVQQTRSTHTLVHFVASYLTCTRGAGPHVYCLVRKMESDEEVLQACAATIVADALLKKPKRKRKKWVNNYLLKRTTKGSYGGLLTELFLENEIFKEYLRMIQSISVSSEILCIQYFCIHQRYCILQRYRVAQPAVFIQSISVSTFHRCHTKRPPTVTAREEAVLPEEISEHARYVHFSALLPLCATLSKLVACCRREMHSLLEP